MTNYLFAILNLAPWWIDHHHVASLLEGRQTPAPWYLAKSWVSRIVSPASQQYSKYNNSEEEQIFATQTRRDKSLFKTWSEIWPRLSAEDNQKFSLQRLQITYVEAPEI